MGDFNTKAPSPRPSPARGGGDKRIMSLVTFEKYGRVGTLTLNDPETLNAMSAAMGAAFQKCAAQIAKDKSLSVVILTGAGRGFSGGGHLDMLVALLDKKKPNIAMELKKFYKSFLAIRDLPQVVIAAINGPAVGAGFCLALGCDLRYASANAKMGANFAKLGLAPGMAGTYLTTRLCGPTRAAEILYTGKIFSAADAFEFGLLNDVVTTESLLPHVQNVAAEIAANAPIVLRQIKKGIEFAQHNSIEKIFNFDAKLQAISLHSADAREGFAAARERRAPRFTGR